MRPKDLRRAAGAGFRTYEESDAPGIARTVRERDELETPAGRSASYEQLRATVAAIAW